MPARSTSVGPVQSVWREIMGKLRGIVAKIFLYILFGLLIISFAVWGIGDMFRGRTPAPVVAEVGGMEVTQEEFRRSFGAEYNRLRQMLGGQFDIEQARSIGLPEQVLADLVSRRLYDAETERLNLAITEEQIRQEIFTIPAFQNEQGQFDRFRYEQVLRANQLTEARLVQQIQQEIARERILSALVSGLEAPQGLATGLYAHRGERRIADYVQIDRSQVANPPAPEEEELQALYEESIDEFQAPEFREVTWLTIDPRQLASDTDFSEQELRDAYEQRRNQFERQERREVQQVLFEEEADAQAAYERARGGEDFAALAEELTGEPPIDLGLVARDEMPPALAEPVFSAEEGSVAAPVETDFGWHLIRVSALEAGGVTPFEEVREQLAEELAEHEAIEDAIALANRLDDLLAGGATLEEAAADLDLEVHQRDAVARAGHDRDDTPLQGLPAPEQFLETAFNTEAGDQSLLVETESGGYFVLRVDGVIPPAPRPFEEVRDAVEQRWRARERETLAFDRADELAERLRDGETLEELAAAENLQVQRSQPATRDASEPSRALVEQLFGVEVGEAVVASGPGGPLLAVLREIEPADPEAQPEQLAQVRDETREALRADTEQLFRQALEREYRVDINQRRIDDVLLEF